MSKIEVLGCRINSITPQSFINKNGLAKSIFMFIAFLVVFPQTAFSQSFNGYLGEPADAFEIRRGLSASYPRYWDSEVFRLTPGREYTCRVWSAEFIPEIWIYDSDETGHSQSTPRSTGTFISPSELYGAEVTFQPLYNSYKTFIEITSQQDSRTGKAPSGRYRVECEDRLASSPIPVPPPTPPQPPPLPPSQPSCTPDTTMMPGAESFCHSYVEFLDAARKRKILHIVNAAYPRRGWKPPSNWHHGRFNECKVLNNDLKTDCIP